MASPNQVFQTVAVKQPPRSAANLSHTWKSTVDFAQLIPNLILEVAPGDAIKCQTNVFMRAMALLSPVMHKVDIYQHYFYVPERLIWDDYEAFHIPQRDETQETIPIRPYMLLPTNSDSEEYKDLFRVGGLADYFGIPPFDGFGDPDNPSDPGQSLADEVSEDRKICTLPFRAYALIFNEYYRDESLMPELEIPMGSGLETEEDLLSLLSMRYRSWEKDYFTSALTRPQLNEPVGFDIGSGSRKVVIDPEARDQQVPNLFRFYNPDAQGVNNDFLTRTPASGFIAVRGELGDNQRFGYIDPNGLWRVEGQSSYITVEQLRQQVRLQEYMELLNRGGNRYTEVIRNLFGVTPDDLRIGRPAYLGGGKQNLVISEVLQQSQSISGESALGEGAGHALSLGSDNRFSAFFKEHGYVIGILSIRPRSEYGQGVERHWLKRDRYEFLNPKFTQLGEQPVRNGELFLSYSDNKNMEGFGYQPVYQEYRYKPSTVHGDLRKNLAFWTLNRRFLNRPNLNASFVQIDPSQLNNIFAVTEAADGSHFICECEHNVRAIRCMPKNPVPVL